MTDRRISVVRPARLQSKDVAVRGVSHDTSHYVDQNFKCILLSRSLCISAGASLSLILGGAGTGKTTVLKVLCA